MKYNFPKNDSVIGFITLEADTILKLPPLVIRVERFQSLIALTEYLTFYERHCFCWIFCEEVFSLMSKNCRLERALLTDKIVTSYDDILSLIRLVLEYRHIRTSDSLTPDIIETANVISLDVYMDFLQTFAHIYRKYIRWSLAHFRPKYFFTVYVINRMLPRIDRLTKNIS